jgi:hypothetical protein
MDGAGGMRSPRMHASRPQGGLAALRRTVCSGVEGSRMETTGTGHGNGV